MNPSQGWPIAAAEQATGKIVLFASSEADWDDDSSMLWSWAPKEATSARDWDAGWGNPTDIRLKDSRFYRGRCFVVCASLGYAGLHRWGDGEPLIWSRNVGGNPHAIELLPDGNVAVAASQGGWVRVYAAALGEHSDVYAEFPLAGAHGVVWDAAHNWLWAVGDEVLTALRVEGTPEEPKLVEVSERRISLPTFGGHDLYPVYGNDDALWVTTQSDIYRYAKSTMSWEEIPREPAAEYRQHVKSIANDASGRRMTVVPDYYKDPQGPCSSRDNWSTDTVDFYPSGGSKRRTGAAFYKARFFHVDYDGQR